LSLAANVTDTVSVNQLAHGPPLQLIDETGGVASAFTTTTVTVLDVPRLPAVSTARAEIVCEPGVTVPESHVTL
jgi:hypothetical protein